MDNTTSTPVPGDQHYYITDFNEIVNPANGAISVRILAPAPHDRGINLPLYAYIYDSNGQFQLIPSWGYNNFLNEQVLNSIYMESPQQGAGGTYPGLQGMYPSGGSVISGALPGSGIPGTITSTPHNISASRGTSGDTQINCEYWDNYIYIDATGGRHSFPSLTAVNNSGITGCGGINISASATGQIVSDGIYTAVFGGSASDVKVYDLHGNLLAPSVKDTNGNSVNGTGRPYAASDEAHPISTTLTVPGLGGPYTYSPTLSRGSTSPMALHPTLVTTNSNCPATFTGPGVDQGGYSGTASLSLPNGQSFVFSPDPTYGLLGKINYPNGASVSYTWSLVPQSQSRLFSLPTPSTSCDYIYDWPAITRRVVNIAGANTQEQDFSYTTTWSSGDWTQRTTTVTTKDLLRPAAPNYRTVYSYVQLPAPYHDGTPVENTIQYYGFDGALLRTIVRTWFRPNQLQGECTTESNGKTKGVFYQYLQTVGSSTTLVTDKAEYDLGAVAATCQQPSSNPARETVTTYWTTPANSVNSGANFIWDRVQTVKTYSNGTLLSETEYAYDQTAVSAVPAGNPLNHDVNYGASYQTGRGNVTTVIHDCVSGCSVSTTAKYGYDAAGQVVSATDAKGNTPTLYSYTDNYASGDGSAPGATDTYITGITYPAVNGVPHSAAFSYGYSDGLLRSSTDENLRVTTYCYLTGGCSGSAVDPWARVTEIDYPDGGQKSASYVDTGANPSWSESTKLNSGGQAITQKTIMDEMGRVTQTQVTSDPGGAVYVDTSYDGLGKIWKQSNPYRASISSTDGSISLSYDALGRKVEQVEQDGTIKWWCYNGIASTSQPNCRSQVGVASGTWIDASDENAQDWQTGIDGLGRLIYVIEPNGANTSPTMETDYTYDANDNLLGVNQLGIAGSTPRTRSFTYDSLSRLLTSTNPETGSISYGYLSGGAFCAGNASLPCNKTDARGVKTTFTYDALNRLTAKRYSDGTSIAGFGYDGNNDSGVPLSTYGITSTNAIGRLSETSNDVNSGNSYSYDAMGRTVLQTTFLPGKPQWNTLLSASYDLAGDGTSLTYPDGRAVQTGFDAAGRMSSVQYQSWNGSTTNLPQTYFSESNGYDPAGHLTSFTYGNGVPSIAAYDSRERLTQLNYGPVGTLWWKQYDWMANGNLQAETNRVTGVQRQYSYDNLNRLTAAQDIFSTLAVPTVANGLTGSTTNSGSGAEETPGVTGAIPLWTDPNDSNLLINADAPGTAGWGVASATISDGVAAPDGTLSASTFTGNAGSTDTYLADSASSASLFDGETVTGSVWLRSPAGAQTINLYFVESGSAGYDIPAYKQVVLTSSWQQYQLSGQFHYGHQNILLQIGGGGTIVAGQSVSLWGATLEDTGTSSPTITNFLPFSQRVTATSWGLNALATDNAAQAPDGTTTAASVTGTSADSFITDIVKNPSPYTGQTITASVWLRAPSGSQRLSLTLLEDGNTPVGTVYVNLTGAWQRFQVSGANSHTLNELALQIGGASTWSNGQVVQIWGSQMEFAPTAGTYVATAGVPEGKGANLTNILTYSQQLSGASWGTSGVILANNALAAPDGSITAAQMTGPQGATDTYVTDDVPNPSLYDSATVTGSVFLRCPTGTKTLGLYFAAENASGRTYLAWGTVALTTTWQRFTYTGQLPNGLTRLFLQIGGSSTFQAGQVVDVWGAQMELASHAGPYVRTTALPVITGSEPVNILPVSQVLNGPSWGIANGTATPNVAGAPDGTSTAATITAGNSSADTYAINSVPNPSLYDEQTVTASIYLRVASGTLNTDLFLVNVGTNGWSNQAQIPVAITTSWQRFAVTGTNQNGLSQLSLQIGGAGTVTSGKSFQLWGAQMVLGSDPAPYTPTNSSTTVYATGQPGTLVQNGLNQSYSYDSFGNILQNGSFESSYTAKNQMLGFAYDAAGNVLSDGMNVMTWDAESRMTSAGGATYVYDAEGSRVEKQGSTVVDTVYFGGQPIARYSAGQWTDLIYGPTGLLAEVPGTQNGVPVYRATDNLGTNVGNILSTGAFVNPMDHTPFGQVFTGSTSDPYLFTGKERDSESGLDYFGARYYGSSMGRFMSPDPMIIMKQKLLDPQQWNMYSYTRNNPLRFKDPTGKYVCADGAKCDSKNDQAFKSRLDNLKTAQAGLKVGSDAYNKIGAVISAYGNAGDTGTANGKTVSVSFNGAANSGGVTQSLDKSTIGVNLASNFTEQSGANNLGTTVLVGHEGQHVVDGAPTGADRLPSEIRAESTSQSILGGFDTRTQSDPSLQPGEFQISGRVLWSPSWSEPGQLSGAPSAAFLIGLGDYKADVQSDNK